MAAREIPAPLKNVNFKIMQNFVFDLYGTLVDIRTDEHSRKFQQQYSRYISKRFGADGSFFEKFFAMLSEYSGVREPDIVLILRDAVAASGGNITQSEGEEAALEFRKLSTHRLKLYRGVKGLLNTLKARGKKLYLLSNAQSVFTVYELKKLGLYDRFDGIELSSDFGEKKPSPAFFKSLVDKYSLNLSQTVYTGNDILCDIAPSKEAGMYAVYIKSAISPAEDSLERAQKLADFATDGGFSAVSKHLIAISED